MASMAAVLVLAGVVLDFADHMGSSIVNVVGGTGECSGNGSTLVGLLATSMAKNVLCRRIKAKTLHVNRREAKVIMLLED